MLLWPGIGAFPVQFHPGTPYSVLCVIRRESSPAKQVASPFPVCEPVYVDPCGSTRVICKPVTIALRKSYSVHGSRRL